MKKLFYLIVLIVVLGLIVSGCIPVVPPAPAEQSESTTLTRLGDDIYYVNTDGSDTYGDGTETWEDNDDDNVWSSGDTGPWLTISYALIQSEVVAGDTINVVAGTYDEQVVITKSLTLQGVGDTTIIKPSQTTAGAFQTWSDGFGHNTAGIITAVTNGLSVTVKNLKVDSELITTNPTEYLDGIFYLETGGTIDSVTVEHIEATGTNIGIYLTAPTKTVSVEVKDCICTNYQKNGMTAKGSTLTVNIHDNTVTGWGSTDVICQNGIQVSDGATGTISGNVVSDHYYTGTGWYACAILIFEAGSLTISENTLTDNQHGAHLSYYTSGSGDGVTIDVSGGTITGAYTGIYLYGDYGGGTVGGDPTLNVNGVTVDGASKNGVYIVGNVDFTLLDSTIKNTVVYGIYINKDQCPVTIDGNIFQSNAGYGIMSYGVSTATPNILTIINNDITGSVRGIGSFRSITTAHYNNISGNTGYGVLNWDDANLDATCNWWGDFSGPYHSANNPGGLGDAVSDNVNYAPWLGMNLYNLRDAIDDLSDEDFNNPKAWSDQKQALLDKIDAVCGQIEDGAYRGAMNKLQHDVIKKIEKWIVDPPQSELIAKVVAEIAILKNFL